MLLYGNLFADNVKWKHANLESPELKTLDIVQFISKFHQTLVEIDFGKFIS